MSYFHQIFGKKESQFNFAIFNSVLWFWNFPWVQNLAKMVRKLDNILFEFLPSLQHSSTSLSQCCELFRTEQDSPTYWLSLTHKIKILLDFVWFSRRKLIVTHIMMKILLFCSINGFMRAKSIFCSRTSRSSNNFDQ